MHMAKSIQGADLAARRNVGTVTLRIGGGPLIVALIVGKLRRAGPLLWAMPLRANIVLRNVGLSIFLAE
jgi:putative transport protein